jgi:hypothetical protein
MSLLFKYVWAVKVSLTGWNAYRACVGDSSNIFICGISTSYFLILLLATLYSCRRFEKPRQIDGIEGEYLRRLEEGIGHEINVKQS